MAEDNRSKKTFVAGAALLGLAGIVVKVLGVFFRVPLANIIGAEGMGIYGVAYPIYILMLTISSSGLPTAISRMIAERRSVGQYYEAYRVFKVSFKVMLGLGLATGIILFVFAPVITGIQKEPEAVMALRATAPALVLCPIMSCYRGFFQGQKADAGSIVRDGITVATTTSGGGLGEGQVTVEYLASIIALDDQGADTPASNSTIYAAPKTDLYYDDYYSVDGLGMTIDSIDVPTKAGWTFTGYFTEPHGQGTKCIDRDGTFVPGAYQVGTTTLYASWKLAVTFDDNGEMTRVERFYTPWQ